MVAFWDYCCVVYQWTIPLGTTITAAYYGSVQEHSWKHIISKRPDIAQGWTLYQDNERPYIARFTFEFLSKHKIWVMTHPRYLPDLTPLNLVYTSTPNGLRTKCVYVWIRLRTCAALSANGSHTIHHKPKFFGVFYKHKENWICLVSFACLRFTEN